MPSEMREAQSQRALQRWVGFYCPPTEGVEHGRDRRRSAGGGRGEGEGNGAVPGSRSPPGAFRHAVPQHPLHV